MPIDTQIICLEFLKSLVKNEMLITAPCMAMHGTHHALLSIPRTFHTPPYPVPIPSILIEPILIKPHTPPCTHPIFHTSSCICDHLSYPFTLLLNLHISHTHHMYTHPFHLPYSIIPTATFSHSFPYSPLIPPCI